MLRSPRNKIGMNTQGKSSEGRYASPGARAVSGGAGGVVVCARRSSVVSDRVPGGRGQALARVAGDGGADSCCSVRSWEVMGGYARVRSRVPTSPIEGVAEEFMSRVRRCRAGSVRRRSDWMSWGVRRPWWYVCGATSSSHSLSGENSSMSATKQATSPSVSCPIQVGYIPSPQPLLQATRPPESTERNCGSSRSWSASKRSGS